MLLCYFRPFRGIPPVKTAETQIWPTPQGLKKEVKDKTEGRAKNSSLEKFKSRTLEEEMIRFLQKEGCPHALQDEFFLRLALHM